jgi:hypothetical protein
MTSPNSSIQEQSPESYDEPVCDPVPGVAVSLEDTNNDASTIRLAGLSVHKRTCLIAIVGTVVLVAAVVVGIIFITGNDSSSDTGEVVHSEEYYKERYNKFRPVIGRLSNPSALVQPGTPQSQALLWLVDKDATLSHFTIDETQLAQRYALLVLFYACGGEQWQGFEATLDKLGSVDTCSLGEFVTCKGNQVVGLDLAERRLIGQLPDEIGLLTNIQTLNLIDNFLKGTIPKTISGTLSNLGALGSPRLHYYGLSASTHD